MGEGERRKTNGRLGLCLNGRKAEDAGFAAVFEGLNPYRATDEALAAKTAGQPLLRIRPVGLANEACDEGGWAWIWSVVATVAAIALVLWVIR